MARNEKTSKSEPSLAATVLSGEIKPTPRQVLSLAASVLTHTPDRLKKSGK